MYTQIIWGSKHIIVSHNNGQTEQWYQAQAPVTEKPWKDDGGKMKPYWAQFYHNLSFSLFKVIQFCTMYMYVS
jgi:hypothetical protein